MNLPSLISITNGSQKVSSKVNYLYRADGTKIRKLSTNLVTSATTDYLDGFQYLKSDTFFGCLDCPPPAAELQFVPTSEGYFDFVKNKYIYNYADHLGNVRVGYFNNGSGIEVLEENNYYPFGLRHEGYNDFDGNPSYQYKYQGQELQNETGWYSFKWRNYMPDLGRFFNIDPLSEKYAYQSHYNFSENRVIDGRELEGLEWVSSRNLEEKTVNLHLTYKLVNNTINALTNDQLKTLVSERQNAINTIVGGKTSEGYNLSFSFTQSEKATIVWDYNMGFDTTNVVDLNNAPKSDIEFALTTALGMTDVIGNTQISVSKSEHFSWNKDGQIEFDKDDRSTIAQTGVHETLHELGLGHLDKETLKDPKNIVQAHPIGTVVTPQQRSTIINNVEEQQKTK